MLEKGADGHLSSIRTSDKCGSHAKMSPTSFPAESLQIHGNATPEADPGLLHLTINDSVHVIPSSSKVIIMVEHKEHR